MICDLDFAGSSWSTMACAEVHGGRECGDDAEPRASSGRLTPHAEAHHVGRPKVDATDN